MSSCLRTVIVIPCFNEAARLNVSAFMRFAETRPDVTLLFVNDGSQDDTLTVLNDMVSRSNRNMAILGLSANMGKAEAVRLGMIQAMAYEPQFLGFWDADLATPLDAVDEFLRVFASHPGVELVFGSRVQLLGRSIERTMIRHYIGRLFATLVFLFLRVRVYDTQCGAKMLRMGETTRRIWGRQFLSRWIFDVELLLRYLSDKADLSNGLDSVYEYPLSQWHDAEGSKLRWRDFIRSFLDLLKIYCAYRISCPRQ